MKKSNPLSTRRTFGIFFISLLILTPNLSTYSSAQTAPPASPYREFKSIQSGFGCDIPNGWQTFETETPAGFVTHILGPAEAGGAWRAALHIHLFERGKPGFVPIETTLKLERASYKQTDRDSTPVSRIRVSGSLAREFEVTEARQLPEHSLPSQSVILHHYYALIADGNDYYVVNLSTTRDTYLSYRDAFEHILATFKLLGHP